MEYRKNERVYAAIDLKSYYASVECVDRGLDPLKTCLVVADQTRTDKTICLAVSPALKAYGIPGRPRLFEVVQKVRDVNAQRRKNAPRWKFSSKSWDADALAADPSLELTYIVAPPRMERYVNRSAEIYGIYLQYVAPSDIFVYSIDEVFLDATPYVNTYGISAREFVRQMISAVQRATGITATAGIGSNLYLAKVAMDIVAKHMDPDKDGVRIAELDERAYRQLLWKHTPLTDFWRVGKGYERKLQSVGLTTMGDIARCSVGKPNGIYSEELLYKLFGVNAELLIDHAWGWEPCTIPQIKAYRPKTNSLSSGQVLHCAYAKSAAEIVVREMTEQLAQQLVAKNLVTSQITLTIGYDTENFTDPKIRARYTGPVAFDHYGRRMPAHSHGTANLPQPTASVQGISSAAIKLYRSICDDQLLIRRINVTACNIIGAQDAKRVEPVAEQLDLFTFSEWEARDAERKRQAQAEQKELGMQKAILALQQKYGKSVVLKGESYLPESTIRSRNEQIGGHRKGSDADVLEK